MGRHHAPETPDGTASVVRMTPARHARSRMGADDTVPVDLAASGGFVDDLTLITADDQLLDGIAAGQGDVFVMPQRFSSGFPAGSLAPLLATWRSEIIDPQWPSLPTAEQVQEAVRAERRPPVKQVRRALKPMLGVAITISALLFSSAAVGAESARPGDVLWPLTRVLYTDRADSYAAGDAARGSLNSADAALSSGNPTSARIALTSAQKEMDKVKLIEVKAPLEEVYATLMSRASVAAVTESEQSAAKVLALQSASASASGTTGRTGVTPPSSGTSKGSRPTGTPSGTSPVRSSGPGAPVTVDPGTPSPTTGVTTPVTAPANPTDPAPTPTGPSTPVTSAPTSPPSQTAPVTSDPATTDPVTTDPVTTDPATTDPSTAPSTDPVTTDASTTSELPTPTPTPDSSTADPGANAVSIAPAAVASQ